MKQPNEFHSQLLTLLGKSIVADSKELALMPVTFMGKEMVSVGPYREVEDGMIEFQPLVLVLDNDTIADVLDPEGEPYVTIIEEESKDDPS